MPPEKRAASTTPDIHVPHPFAVRDLSSPAFTEIWLVGAITTVLGTRLYLELTGYPQVGGATLHIAHMLWGGLAMVIAFGMLLIMASAVWKPTAALIGGFGFGLFIDELGKFITKDNDYFYRPTIALIYAVFVGLFLVSRTIDRIDKITPSDRVLYATQCLEQYAIGKLDEDGRQAGLKHLELSGMDTALTRAIREALEEADVRTTAAKSRLVAWRDRLVALYWRITGNTWLIRLVFIGFGVQALNFVASVALAITDDKFDLTNGLSFSESGALLSGLVAGAFAAYGTVMVLRGIRLSGLKALATATLVTLLFGQFFAFAANQFAALGSLVLQLMILGALRFAITAEEHTTPDESSGLPIAELQAIDDSNS